MLLVLSWASQVALVVKKKKKKNTCQCRDIRDTSLIPGWGRSPGEGNGNSPQDSCLENPMNRGAWWATEPDMTEATWRACSFILTSFFCPKIPFRMWRDISSAQIALYRDSFLEFSRVWCPWRSEDHWSDMLLTVPQFGFVWPFPHS